MYVDCFFGVLLILVYRWVNVVWFIHNLNQITGELLICPYCMVLVRYMPLELLYVDFLLYDISAYYVEGWWWNINAYMSLEYLLLMTRLEREPLISMWIDTRVESLCLYGGSTLGPRALFVCIVCVLWHVVF